MAWYTLLRYNDRVADLLIDASLLPKTEDTPMKFFEQVHRVVARIPPGRVATYGQIAHILGQPHAARTVGWALRGSPEGLALPWHRVVNAAGHISIADPRGVSVQQQLLESEGVFFDSDGRIDLDRFGWEGLTEDEIRTLIAEL